MLGLKLQIELPHGTCQKILADQAKKQERQQNLSMVLCQIIQLHNYNWSTVDSQKKGQRDERKIDFMSKGSPGAHGDCGYNVVLYICLQQTHKHSVRNKEMQGGLQPAACCHLSKVITVHHSVPFLSLLSGQAHTCILVFRFIVFFMFCESIPLTADDVVGLKNKQQEGEE